MAQIDIRLQSVADLKGFTDAVKATQGLKKETDGLGHALKEGLGVGGGIELVHRGIDLLKETIIETAKESFRMASEIHDGAEAVGVSSRAYQVLGEVMKEAGGTQERMTQAIAASNPTGQHVLSNAVQVKLNPVSHVLRVNAVAIQVQNDRGAGRQMGHLIRGQRTLLIRCQCADLRTCDRSDLIRRQLHDLIGCQRAYLARLQCCNITRLNALDLICR